MGMQGKGVCPVVAMVNNAAASDAAAEANVAGHDCPDFVYTLGVAKSDCRLCPTIVAENGTFFGYGSEQRGIDCHVGSSISRSVGQDNDLHGDLVFCNARSFMCISR